MAKKRLDVTVKKSRWYRGKGAVGSALLCDTGNKMCCIGFLARACGLQPKDIRGRAGLEDLDETTRNTSLMLRNLVMKQDAWLSAAYVTNDDQELTDKERIKQLMSLGRKFGVNFTFAN